MKLKYSTIITFFFLFLLASPCFSRGGSDLMETEVYEIDYRGPETHSSVPPPDHSHGKKPLPLIYEKSAMASPKAKSSNMGRKAKNIHG